MERKYYLRGLGIGIAMTAIIMGIALSGDRKMTDDEIIARAKELGMVENTVLANTEETEEENTDTSDGDRQPDQTATPAHGDEVEDNGAAQATTDDQADADRDDQAEVAASQKGKAEAAAQKDEAEGKAAEQKDQAETSQSSKTGTDADQASQDSKTGTDAAQSSQDSKTEASAGKPAQDDVAAATQKPAGTMQKPAAENTITAQKPADEEEDADEAEPERVSGIITSAAVKTITVNHGDGSYTVAKKLEDVGVVTSAATFDSFLCQNGYDKRLRTGTFSIPADASDEQIARIVTGAE